ncbi:MAG TPA: acetamidase/formamidase family protein [Myxococcales bacterium]|nr:acetamidase/formamidase family protein [Myxococcales bacterium]
MKRVLILALSAVAAAPSFAKTVVIPVSRGAGGVPVPCGEDPLRTCHNRWHPDIPEAAVANAGDTVIFETRDAFDNPFNRTSTPATVAAANLNLIHPLTGPLFVNGAKRGDVLAVTMIDVGPGPDNFGYTVAVPGFGFLRDVFTDPAIAHWELGAPPVNGIRYATSRDLPGVRLPLHGFAGTIGVELGRHEIEAAFAREEELRAKQGFVLPPEPTDAVPSRLCGPNGREKERCLRTIPPRENGGNTDVKQMVKGTTLLFPCFIDGCGLSVGDVHWAQGDGEVSGTAIEMNAIVTVKVDVRKHQAAAQGNWPRFESSVAGVLKDLDPQHFVATMGIPVKPAGVVMAPELWIEANTILDANGNHLLRPLRNESEDVTLAARDALLKMIGLLTGPTSPAPVPLTAEQAYLLCSVACDLHISNLVDVPNYVVSNFLQLDVFDH